VSPAAPTDPAIRPSGEIQEDRSARLTLAGKAPEGLNRALAEALSRVGDRWTLAIVAALLEGPRRFGDLQDDLEGIAPNVLSARLQRLAEEGLILAEPYSERPQRFAYALTERGRGLAGPIRLLSGWAARELPGADSPVHEACGSQLEALWFCPTCQRPVEEGEAVELHYA
jgi:DNA-binding HxlR family transcriptional regulator